MNWLHGTPTTVKPRSRYSSCSDSSAVYCGVRPQRLATLTSSAGRPPVSAPRVVSSPCRVATGRSSRSVTGAPRRGWGARSPRTPAPIIPSLEAAHVVGDVDGVLAQRLQRDDVERAGGGGGQHDAGGCP